jgi:hypothetical protein
MLSVVMLNVCHYAECRYAECRYVECHYAECHYAECRGALKQQAFGLRLMLNPCPIIAMPWQLVFVFYLLL